MTELSEGLNKYWDNQIDKGNVVAKPFSGNCMFCSAVITEEDDDHSVCNTCWENEIGEEE